MPDWVYQLLEAFGAVVNRVTLVDMLVLTVACAVVAALAVLIHEAGHAVAALAVRRRVPGLVRFDGLRADARSTFVIALAGPLSSLAGAVLTGARTRTRRLRPGRKAAGSGA